MDITIPWPDFTPDELRALFGIFAVIYGATETIKRLLRHLVGRAINAWRSDVAWIVAIAVSLIVSFCTWPASSSLPWWVIGAAAGPLSSVVYKLVAAALYKVSPAAANTLTGNRRRRDQPAPGDIERRQE